MAETLVVAAIGMSVATTMVVASQPLLSRLSTWWWLLNKTSIKVPEYKNKALHRAITGQLAALTRGWYQTDQQRHLTSISYDDPDGTRVYFIPEPGITVAITYPDGGSLNITVTTDQARTW